ncbi:helix-turn-helix transcriptional regulator [Cellvibrio sp. QJXJ]|nr:helix-turn-helix transcriptional regulator [Cellvibrio sp. QJXJ]
MVALPSADLNLLTGRERAVAELVAAGKTNKEVARELDITERTVKAHLGASFEKLGVRDRLQLALAFSNNAKA